MEPGVRITAEQALTALERVTDGFVAFDSDWNYTYVNARAAEMLGRPADQLVGRHIWTEFPEGVGQPFHQAYERAMATQQPVFFEDYYAPWDRWFENRCYPSSGGLSIFFSEVTDRRRVELEMAQARAQLTATQQRLEQILDHAPSAIFVKRAADLRYEIVNQRFVDLLGGRAEDYIGHSDEEFLPPEGAAAVTEHDRLVIARGEPLVAEELVTTVSGPRAFLSTKFPLRGEDGSVAYVCGIATDITDRNEALAQLAAAEERFAATFEHAPVGMFVTSTEPETRGTITEVNRAAAEITGFSQEQLAGRHFVELVAEGGREDIIAFAQRRIAGDTSTIDLEVPVRRADGGEAWVAARASIVMRGDGRPLHGLTVVQDITPRRRAEAERERLTARLQQAERLESLGRLAGGVAHDFNNILAVVQGYSEMLVKDLADRPTLREDAQEIHRAAERATALTRQLLLFSDRGESPEAVDAVAVVRGLESLLRGSVAADVQLDLALPAEPVPVALERARLEQVVLNLVVNAGDAVASGGRVEVEVSTTGDLAHLRVGDDGSGMTPEVARKAFDPFFTTKPRTEATGLGLATVYGIVSGAGGTVTIESEPGAGSTICVELPLAAQLPAQDAAERPAPGPVGTGETVLVVEDEEPVRRLVTRVLADHGYRVLSAADPLEAVSRPEVAAGAVDLLLTDLTMSGMDGETLAAELQAADPGLRVLFLTGHPLRRQDDRAHEDTLVKPVSASVLLERVRQVLDAPRQR